MTQSLLQRLHELNPCCQIDVFAPKWVQAIYSHMPEVHEIFDNPFAHGALCLRERWRVGRELGKRGYHQVIVLPGSLKSALIAWATGILQRTGYVGEHRYLLLNDIRRLDKARLSLMVDRYTALAYPNQDDFNGISSQPNLAINPLLQQQALEKHQLNKAQPIVAFCPGAEYGSAKRWFPEHFADTARYYHQLGYQIWLFGSHKDFDIAEQINQLSDNICQNLCGKTSLDEAIDLLACADWVVCNDSGLMHVAAAVGCRLIAVYGSSSPAHTPPLSDKAHIASLNLNCSPCFKRECPLGHTNCLRLLLPEKVIELTKLPPN